MTNQPNPPDVGNGRASVAVAGVELHENINDLMTLLGRKWNLIILYYLLVEGALGFNELNARITRVSNKVLSESLKDLENRGLLDRTITSEQPVRVEYSLTEQGVALRPVVEAVCDFCEEWWDSECTV